MEPWFANLLTDNGATLRSLQRRFSLWGTSAFELLDAVGGDWAGAVQLLPPENHPLAWIVWRPRPSPTMKAADSMPLPESFLPTKPAFIF